VIRVFNENQDIVQENLRALNESLSGLKAVDKSIILVDDGSLPPFEMKKCNEIVRHTSLWQIRHNINLGAGAALETGFEFIRRHLPEVDWVATFDPDGQHRADDVKTLLDHASQKVANPRETAFSLFGSRFLGEVENIDPGRLWILRLARFFTNAFYGFNLTDVHNGLRVFSRKAIDHIRLRSADFTYASEMLHLIKLHGITVEEHPVRICYTDYSKSKGQKNLNALSILKNMILGRIIP